MCWRAQCPPIEASMDCLEIAAAGIGAAFGTGSVSPTLAAALRELLPGALFLR